MSSATTGHCSAATLLAGFAATLMAACSPGPADSAESLEERWARLSHSIAVPSSSCRKQIPTGLEVLVTDGGVFLPRPGAPVTAVTEKGVIDAPGLTAALRRELEASPSRQVVLRIDREAPVALATSVLTCAYQAGASECCAVVAGPEDAACLALGPEKPPSPWRGEPSVVHVDADLTVVVLPEGFKLVAEGRLVPPETHAPTTTVRARGAFHEKATFGDALRRLRAEFPCETELRIVADSSHPSSEVVQAADADLAESGARSFPVLYVSAYENLDRETLWHPALAADDRPARGNEVHFPTRAPQRPACSSGDACFKRGQDFLLRALRDSAALDVALAERCRTGEREVRTEARTCTPSRSASYVASDPRLFAAATRRRDYFETAVAALSCEGTPEGFLSTACGEGHLAACEALQNAPQFSTSRDHLLELARRECSSPAPLFRRPFGGRAGATEALAILSGRRRTSPANTSANLAEAGRKRIAAAASSAEVREAVAGLSCDAPDLALVAQRAQEDALDRASAFLAAGCDLGHSRSCTAATALGACRHSAEVCRLMGREEELGEYGRDKTEYNDSAAYTDFSLGCEGGSVASCVDLLELRGRLPAVNRPPVPKKVGTDVAYLEKLCRAFVPEACRGLELRTRGTPALHDAIVARVRADFVRQCPVDSTNLAGMDQWSACHMLAGIQERGCSSGTGTDCRGLVATRLALCRSGFFDVCADLLVMQQEGGLESQDLDALAGIAEDMCPDQARCAMNGAPVDDGRCAVSCQRVRKHSIRVPTPGLMLPASAGFYPFRGTAEMKQELGCRLYAKVCVLKSGATK